jgi:transcriptional regulator of met regulon
MPMDKQLKELSREVPVKNHKILTTAKARRDVIQVLVNLEGT